jgi:asparagine synthase (glutamine-hydrolysing)
LFIEYSAENWHQWAATTEWQEYLKFAGNLSVVPHIQDWPAVYEMKRQGMIPADSILIPGHAAHMGETLTYSGEVRRLGPLNLEKCIKAVLEVHYNLWDWPPDRLKIEPRLRERILYYLDEPSSHPDCCSLFESFRLDNRNSKFVVNSCRVYEYFGYDWWLPLFDRDYTDYWAAIPLHYRQGKKLYNSYVDQQYSVMTGTDKHVAQITERDSLPYRIKEFTEKHGKSLPLLSSFYYAMKRWHLYENHPLAWNALVPRELYKRLYTGRETINSFLALERLGRIKLHY